MTRTWEQLITEGREAIELADNVQWRVGDMGNDLPPGHSLEEFAAEIGADYDLLVSWVDTARAWPAAERNTVAPWVSFRDTRREPHRFELMRAYVAKFERGSDGKLIDADGKKPGFRSFQAHWGKRPTLEISKKRMVEQASEAARRMSGDEAANVIEAALEAHPELLAQTFNQIAQANPAVVDEAYRDVNTAAALAGGSYRKYQADEARRRATIETDGVLRKIDQQRAALDLSQAVEDFTRACELFNTRVRELSPRLGELDQENLGLLLKLGLQSALEALTSVSTFVKTGRSDLDAFLSGVLGR
jgi:hypothetical protein